MLAGRRVISATHPPHARIFLALILLALIFRRSAVR